MEVIVCYIKDFGISSNSQLMVAALDLSSPVVLLFFRPTNEKCT